MELESMRFYQTAAKRTTNLSARKLLDEVAVAEQAHEDLAGRTGNGIERDRSEEGRGSNPPADVCSSGHSTGSCGAHGWICLDVAPAFAAALPRETVGMPS